MNNSTPDPASLSVKTVPLTIYIPECLLPAIDTRAEEEGYGGRSALGRALFVYDILARRPHQVTAKIHAMPQDAQDEIMRQIALGFEGTERKPGGWLHHRIEELVKEELAKISATPETHAVPAA